MKGLRLVAGLSLLLSFSVGAAACGSDDDGGNGTGSGSGPKAAAGTSIEIVDFTFEPGTLRAKVGDTITVTNSDDTDHTVTADDGAFDTGDVAGMGTATFELTEPGELAYHCDIHNYMTGTIQVSE